MNIHPPPPPPLPPINALATALKLHAPCLLSSLLPFPFHTEIQNVKLFLKFYVLLQNIRSGKIETVEVPEA